MSSDEEPASSSSSHSDTDSLIDYDDESDDGLPSLDKFRQSWSNSSTYSDDEPVSHFDRSRSCPGAMALLPDPAEQELLATIALDKELRKSSLSYSETGSSTEVEARSGSDTEAETSLGRHDFSTSNVESDVEPDAILNCDASVNCAEITLGHKFQGNLEETGSEVFLANHQDTGSIQSTFAKPDTCANERLTLNPADNATTPSDWVNKPPQKPVRKPRESEQFFKSRSVDDNLEDGYRRCRRSTISAADRGSCVSRSNSNTSISLLFREFSKHDTKCQTLDRTKQPVKARKGLSCSFGFTPSHPTSVDDRTFTTTQQQKTISSTMDMNSEAENLFGFLESIGLQRYYDVIRNELKIETVQQLKQVQEQELEDIRMKKEDIHKLKKNMKKEQSQSAFGKLKKRLSRSTSDNQALRNSRSSAATMSAEPLTPPPVVGRRIIPRDQISVQSDIGQGEFGVVKHAIFSNDSGQKVEVAAKSLSQSRLEHGLNDFLKEASSMQSISHPNIVTFYGLVFQEEKEIMIITEYAPLRSLLECLHNESLHVVLTVSKLSTFATQIATGMTYLETQGLIHRDLAARNILVFSHNKVKIGDFGLSRALGLDKEYYQTKYRADLKIPIAWCAPECMNLLRFSTASDVWSFGVIMWEMFTYGKKPWDRFSSLEMSAEEIHLQIYTAINAPKSERLPRPKLCPTGHYELMLKCWAHEPEQRPKFGDILIQLKTIQPTVMKAIKNSDAGSCTMDYKENENITVIDKKPVDAPSWQFWFGVMDDGRSGLFTPTDCVPLSGDASPAVQLKSKTPPKTHNSSIGNFISDLQTGVTGFLETMKKTTQSSQSPPKGRKRVTRDMISAPQCDFKHTGHIGYDGVTFGNIGDIKSVIGSEPIEKVLTGKGANGDVGHTNGNAATDTLGSSHSQNNGQSNGLNWSNDATDSQPPVTDIDELGDFEFPDLSLSESLGDFGTSFIDDMIKGFSEKYTNSNVNNNSKKSSAEQLNGSRHSPTHASSSSTTGASYAPDQSQGDATSAAQLQSSLTHNADTNKQQKSSKSKPPKLVLPGSNLKEMSASDQKMIDDVIQMVNQMAQSTLTTPRSPEEKPETPGRSKLKFSFKMSKKSPKNEKKTFTEQLEDQAEKPLVSPEAEEAYNVLVAKKPVSNRHRNPSNEDRRIASRRSQIRPPPHQPPEPPTPTHTVPQLTSSHPPPHAPHRNSTIERPKDRPPLPPVACGVLHSFTNVHDLSDIPTTPPPPIPSGATKSVGTGIHTKLPQGHRQAAEPVYDNMDVIGTYDSNTEPPTLKSFFTGRYKSSSDNVSYEDLLEFSDERRAVRQIQNYLGFQVSDDSCMMALEKCQNNSQNAVKFLKLKQLHGLRLCSIELCKKALLQCNWDVKVAADYILNNRNNVELVGV